MKLEFSNVCSNCKKRKKSRIFFFPIKEGDYPYLCKDCWEDAVKIIEGDSWNPHTTEAT